MDFELQSFDDYPACLWDIARLSTAMFFLTFDTGSRLGEDEDGGMETRIITLETKDARTFGDFLASSFHLKDRLHCQILGVCDPPKDKVNVASIAMFITSRYFSTFVPLSENL